MSERMEEGMEDEARPLQPNDEGTYRNKSVRLLYPADPMPGWIGVELRGSIGGERLTGQKMHIDDISKFELLVLQPPKKRDVEQPTQQEADLHTRIASLESDLRQAKAEREELEEDKNFFENNGAAAFNLLADALGLKSGGLLETAIAAKEEIDRLRTSLARLTDENEKLMMAVAERVKAECAKVAALNYKHCRGGGLHITDIDTAAIVAAVMEGEGEKK